MPRTIVVAQCICTSLLLAPFVGCETVPREYAGAQADADAGGRGLASGIREHAMRLPPTSPPAFAEGDETLGVELASQTGATQPASARVLIYSAGLQLAVTDIQKALARAQELAEEAGGYLQSMSQSQITVRVPAKAFEEVLGKLEAMGQVLDKSIQANDVTDEYVDLALRLKNAEALRDRLLAILEKATTVEDMLKVETELNRVREEVERLKGRLADLDRRIAYSTIEIAFVEAATPTAKKRRPQAPFRWLDDLGVESVLQITRSQ